MGRTPVLRLVCSNRASIGSFSGHHQRCARISGLSPADDPCIRPAGPGAGRGRRIGGMEVVMPESGTTQQFRDAELKVAGQIPYALNVDLPGLAHARCVRSPYAHARILKIDTSSAEALEGVVCVLTRADIQDGSIFPYYGAAIKDQPIVAIDKARHVGDVIAAVVAETPEIASE